MEIGTEGDEVDERGAFVDASQTSFSHTTLIQDTMSSEKSRSDSGDILDVKLPGEKDGPRRKKGKKAQKRPGASS